MSLPFLVIDESESAKINNVKSSNIKTALKYFANDVQHLYGESDEFGLMKA